MASASARNSGGQVRLYSRPGNDFTRRFPLITEAFARLRLSKKCRPLSKKCKLNPPFSQMGAWWWPSGASKREEGNYGKPAPYAMESWDWVPASVIYGMGVGGLMFACAVRCESIYEVKRNDAAKQRWHAFLARGNSRS
jgi:hypothetical protein